MFKKTLFIILLLCAALNSFAQHRYELNKGWRCMWASQVPGGDTISRPATSLEDWMPAVVPGTVLTTMLHNKKIPDPFYGMNNKRIPDIYDVGSSYYTYWFVNDFKEKAGAGEHVWLKLNGVNYAYDLYLNGHKLNNETEKGMFLRRTFDITPYLAKDTRNRLAIIVYPPNPVGNPNGGQGGDGLIAKSVTNQYVAGWDWIQPIHDRNTGIWDKVLIEKTGAVRFQDVHIETHVPGIRFPGGQQPPAAVTVNATMLNAGTDEVNGVLQCQVNGRTIIERVTIPAGQSEVPLHFAIDSPRLWWPNGVGAQNLYHLKLHFLQDRKGVSDVEELTFGVRELSTAWNATTNSRELYVNGQRIFIKGGNWILSDAMLRFSKERYDAEVRYHKDMNLNMLRVWGGGITERPEFYAACDKYGLLVMQDFWITGDCNGRWHDTYKKEDTTKRRQYPDDHQLWLASCADQIKMLRNHPSLAYWCGGNELRPPEDILRPLRDSVLPMLDSTRYFFEYSNHDSMSLNAHDGPYTIQKDDYFWGHRSYAFNSEIGSVGMGDIVSLERFIPKENLVAPHYDTAEKKWLADSVWRYHKYGCYDSAVEAYGHPKNAKDFANKAQLVNYNQYRALMEGFRAHMWDWYTGVMIWKTQNPWTAMVGQMYDAYLDPNACMYGLQAGAKPVHVVYDPVRKSVFLMNSSTDTCHTLRFYHSTIWGAASSEKFNDTGVTVPPNSCVEIGSIGSLDKPDYVRENTGAFLYLEIYDTTLDKQMDENLYWFPDKNGSYNWLNHMEPAPLHASATYTGTGKIEVKMENTSDEYFSFFNHITLVDKKTKKRILPIFCNNNYIFVPPSEERMVTIEYIPRPGVEPMVYIDGWNGSEHIDIKKGKK